jgi:hypothetical protein
VRGGALVQIRFYQLSPHRDINGYSKSNSVMEPLAIYKGHSSVVEVPGHAFTR